MSCATRGLQLSEQIPSMHPEYNNPKVLGYVESNKDIKLDNIYFIGETKETFLKDYFNKKQSNRAIASDQIYKSEFKTTEVTIEPKSFGVLLNN